MPAQDPMHHSFTEGEWMVQHTQYLCVLRYTQIYTLLSPRPPAHPKYNLPYMFFFSQTCATCFAHKHTATLASSHQCTRACHLRRHTDTNPIIRARRWQTTQPWVVVKTKAIHILRNERSVQLTLHLPLYPVFLLQIICTRKPPIFLQLCDF